MRTLMLLSLFLVAGAAAAQAQREKVAAGAPCCSITAVNARTGVVTAQNRATGKSLQFQVNDRQLLGTLTTGQNVWVDAAGRAGVTPGAPCCAVLAPDALAPCCAITAINARTGVVTARNLATGKTFRFEFKDRALLKTLTAGQGVWADFAAKQVSVRPADPAGNPAVNPAEHAGQPSVLPVPPCCTILPE